MTSNTTVAHLRATSIYGAQPKEGLLMGRQTVPKRVEATGANVLGAPSALGWTRRAGQQITTVMSQALTASSLSSTRDSSTKHVLGWPTMLSGVPQKSTSTKRCKNGQIARRATTVQITGKLLGGLEFQRTRFGSLATRLSPKLMNSPTRQGRPRTMQRMGLQISSGPFGAAHSDGFLTGVVLKKRLQKYRAARPPAPRTSLRCFRGTHFMRVRMGDGQLLRPLALASAF
mmetsp:Transcript_62993/g.124533  ORF Transcript_62993/g.124533 Transcript_62993/m.124533 type:complete len:230 (+) Transcript_62993:1400-2089(+)